MPPRRTKLDTGTPGSILFVGNSLFYYNNSLHSHINNLRAKSLRCTSVTINGASLSWHNVDAYFNTERIGAYSFSADNKVVFSDPGRKPFDVVVMVDSTQGPIHPVLRPLFFEYAEKHCGDARKHGAEPTLFMSWAYADMPEMTNQLAEAYAQAGKDNDAVVIPVGCAFAAAVATHPEINLYQPDKRHPSLAGTYLAACTVAGALFGETPERNAYTAGLPPETASVLQAVAWNTLCAYYK